MASSTVIPGATSLGSPTAGANIYVQGGNAAITTNVDQSGLTDIARFEIAGPYTGQLATAGAPVKVRISTALINAGSAGDVYFQSAGSGSTVSALVQCIGTNHFHFVTGGTVTDMEILSGQLTVSAAPIVTNLRASGPSIVNVYDSTTTALTILRMSAGKTGTGPTVYCQRAITTATNDAGNLTIEMYANNANAIATLNCTGPVGAASTKVLICGTITTLTALGHIPDFSGLVTPLTITNTEINMNLPGAAALLNNPLITFTNAATKRFTDGRQA